ncbi:MAG TPA: WD40 repeat domain-containing protein [Cytophagaceae bacterium]|jgi:WD40 repeat protein|nr:WD40 repeat domain-containing protein [Cytophagaceae bacterium]
MINITFVSLVKVEKITSLTGHRDCIYALEKGKEENFFFSAAGDGMVVLWDLKNPENGTLIAKVENSVYALKYLPLEHQLLVGHNFRGIHLIDVGSKKELYSAAITDSYLFDIEVIEDKIIVATGNGFLVVLSAKDLTTLNKIKLSDQSIRSIALSPDGNFMALAFSDNSIRILEVASLKMVYEFEAHKNSVFTVAFSPDGKYLLSGSRDAHLTIWDVQNDFKIKEKIVAHLFAINHIAFSPDGKHFATCSLDKSIKIWDAEQFRLLKVIDKARHVGHGTSVNKLFWSDYNDVLVAASDDRSISVWNIEFNN